jgi:large subunit ribosomal protein L14
MIQKGSFLNVIDNSGAQKVECIQVVCGYRRRYGSLGDILCVSIKSLRSNRSKNSKVKKGDVVKALIVRSRIFRNSYVNNKTKFYENAVVLLNDKKKFTGSRIFGGLPKFLRYTKYLRAITLSSGVLF